MKPPKRKFELDEKQVQALQDHHKGQIHQLSDPGNFSSDWAGFARQVIAEAEKILALDARTKELEDEPVPA